MITEKQILKLRPSFKLHPDGMTIIDWFDIQKSESFYIIKSGLVHADGVTKSPYFYYNCIVGKNVKKESLKLFNEWWNDRNRNSI